MFPKVTGLVPVQRGFPNCPQIANRALTRSSRFANGTSLVSAPAWIVHGVKLQQPRPTADADDGRQGILCARAAPLHQRLLRHAVHAYVAREEPDLPVAAIGVLIGQRDAAVIFLVGIVAD